MNAVVTEEQRALAHRMAGTIKAVRAKNRVSRFGVVAIDLLMEVFERLAGGDEVVQFVYDSEMEGWLIDDPDDLSTHDDQCEFEVLGILLDAIGNHRSARVVHDGDTYGVVASEHAEDYSASLEWARSMSWAIEWDAIREICLDTARTVAYYREVDQLRRGDMPLAQDVIFEVLEAIADNGGSFGSPHAAGIVIAALAEVGLMVRTP